MWPFYDIQKRVHRILVFTLTSHVQVILSVVPILTCPKLKWPAEASALAGPASFQQNSTSPASQSSSELHQAEQKLDPPAADDKVWANVATRMTVCNVGSWISPWIVPTEKTVMKGDRCIRQSIHASHNYTRWLTQSIGLIGRAAWSDDLELGSCLS